MSKLINPYLDNLDVLAQPDSAEPAIEIADAGGDGLMPVAVEYSSESSESPVLGVLSRATETNTNKAGVTRILVKTVMPCRAWAPAKGCACGEADQLESVDGESITVHTVITLPKPLVSNARGTDVTLVTKVLKQVDIALKAHLSHFAQQVGYSGAAFSKLRVEQDDGGITYHLSALDVTAVAGDASLLSDAKLKTAHYGAIAALRRLITETGSDDVQLDIHTT